MIMARYFIDFSSWVEVEANSEREARAKFWNGEYNRCGESEIIGIERDDEEEE